MKKRFSLLLSLSLIVVLWGVELPASSAANKPIEFRWVSLMAIPNLDPTQMHSIPTYVVAQNLYDTLVFPDIEKGYIPWIAESWKISPDGKKYTFFLKKGVPFHDGTEMTAEDVAFSMDRLVTMKESTMAPFFKAVKPGTTKVLDRYSLEFNLTQRSPELMTFLFMFKIMNKKEILKNKAQGAYGEFGDYGVEYLRTHDAGSGPFITVEHRVGNSLRMKRFDAYRFEPWKPNSVDTVRVTTIPEAVTEVTKLKMGELDMGEWTLPTRSLKELQKDENFLVSEELTDGLWTCAMNNTKPPLDDPFVRKAVAHAWNTELITSTIISGGKPARGPLPDSLRGGCSDIPYYPYDLEKAKELLKKSKYSAEELKGFELEMAGGVSERFTSVLLSFYSDLKKIGLNPKITMMTWPDASRRQQKPETAFHFSLTAHKPIAPHPMQFLDYYTKQGWGKAYPLGGIYYSNPKVEEAINLASSAPTIEEQKKYYCLAQKQIAEDCPAIFSHVDHRLFPMWRYVKGYKYPVGCEYFHLRFNRFIMDTEDSMFKKNHGW